MKLIALTQLQIGDIFVVEQKKQALKRAKRDNKLYPGVLINKRVIFCPYQQATCFEITFLYKKKIKKQSRKVENMCYVF